jgi:DNA-binding transcriptional MerR regulator
MEVEVSSRIPQKIFFRIGEVCELIKVQPHVLRYWETEFPMLAPQKNRAGQRVYRRKDVEMVMRIRDLLYEEKFTIAGAKKRLLDEIRSSSPRARARLREPDLPDETIEEPTPEPEQAVQAVQAPQTPILPGLTSTPGDGDRQPTPQVKKALRTLKRDLEDLLTLLKTGC